MYLILKATQERFKANVEIVEVTDLVTTKKWLFEWRKEYNKSENFVYKVITLNNQVIHGLISITKKNDHIFVNVLEVSAINRGKNKAFENVAGILFAFACRLSFSYGFEGFVVFESKTVLKKHYANTYGAILLNGNRMFFDDFQAMNLINKYL